MSLTASILPHEFLDVQQRGTPAAPRGPFPGCCGGGSSLGLAEPWEATADVAVPELQECSTSSAAPVGSAGLWRAPHCWQHRKQGGVSIAEQLQLSPVSFPPKAASVEAGEWDKRSKKEERFVLADLHGVHQRGCGCDQELGGGAGAFPIGSGLTSRAWVHPWDLAASLEKVILSKTRCRAPPSVLG